MEKDEERSNILGKRHISTLFKVNNLTLSAKDSKLRYSSENASNYHLKIKSVHASYELQKSD